MNENIPETSSDNAIVIVTNDHYLKYAQVLLNSIKENWRDHPDISLFIHTSALESVIKLFAEDARIQVIPFNPESSSFRKYLPDNSKAFSSKLFNDAGFFFLNFWLNDLLPHKNLLILDADMIVLKPLTELFLQPNFFGVTNGSSRILPYFNIVGTSPLKLFHYAAAIAKAIFWGIPLHRKASFNSGLIYLPKEDRSIENFSLLVNLLRRFRKYCLGDQEIIQMWMAKKGKEISLDVRYNFQVKYFSDQVTRNLLPPIADWVTRSQEDIYVLHFAGPKPDTKEFVNRHFPQESTDLLHLYRLYE